MDRKIHERIAKALFEQTVPDFNNYYYCISMDIGGGNCSMAVANLQPNQNHAPRLLKLSQRGETSLWSNIGYEALPGEKGKISIGKRAQNQKYQFSNYKIVPTDKNLELEVTPDNYAPTGDFLADASVRRTNRELTRDYIRELFQSALHHPENTVLRNTPLQKMVIIVGHPSSDDWKNRQAHDNLVQIIREATGVSAVLTTSESNAAILYALNNRSQIGAADKILIVDLGAYSADITWIDRRKLERRYASMALGGKSIDKNIAQIILENSGRDRSELDPDYNLIYEARTLKEHFWPWGTVDQKTFVKVSGKEIWVTIINKDFDKAVKEMPVSVQNTTTGQEVSRSYTDHLSAFLEAAKTEWKITQVDWVLVTGGAARMKPAMAVIRSKSQALWGVQDENIWSSVISNNLVVESVPIGSLQFCLKSRDVLDRIPEVYDKLKKEAEKMVSPIAKKISKDVVDYLMPKAIEPVLLRFRDTQEIPTVEKLEIALTVALEQDKHKNQIRKLADDAAKSISKNNKAGFQKIITEFLEELYSRKAGNATWNWNTNIDPDIVFDGSVAKTIRQTVTTAVENNIFDIVLGIIVLLSSLLWAALLVAMGIVTVAMENWRKKHWTQEQWNQWEREQEKKKAREEQEKKQKEQEEYQKVRSRRKRRKIYKMVMEEETRNKLQNAVEEKIYSQLKEKCDENGFGVPGAYLDQLTEDICNAVYTGL